MDDVKEFDTSDDDDEQTEKAFGQSVYQDQVVLPTPVHGYAT